MLISNIEDFLKIGWILVKYPNVVVVTLNIKLLSNGNIQHTIGSCIHYFPKYSKKTLTKFVLKA